MKKIVYIIIFVAVVAFFIFSILYQLRGGDQNAPELISRDGLAVMENDEEITTELTSAEYRQLREDVKFVAVNYMDTYKDLEKEVVFRFSSFSKNNSSVFFEGKYRDDKRTITIESSRGNNERLLSSISLGNETYTETLPSQSLRNKYISTLPIEEQSSYVIEYDIARETFVLSLFRLETGDSALASIENATGIPSSQEDVNIVPLGDDNLDRFFPEDLPPRNGAEVVTE